MLRTRSRYNHSVQRIQTSRSFSDNLNILQMGENRETSNHLIIIFYPIRPVHFTVVHFIGQVLCGGASATWRFEGSANPLSH
jgi:hypothetical protein